jgi:hypothetical protein
MDSDGLDLIAIIFGAFNLLRLASYFPQITAVARDQHGASAISLSCWSIWIGANGSTGLYAWFNLQDETLAWIGAFNAACCAVVVLLTMYKRVTVRRAIQPLSLGTGIGAAKPSLVSTAAPGARPDDAPRCQLQAHIVGSGKTGLNHFSGLCG